jgi:hypothetical protein
VWNIADFATAAGVGRVAGNEKGVFTGCEDVTVRGEAR